MAKVVTSDGGVQSTEVIADKKRPAREAAAPLEVVKQPVAVEIGDSDAKRPAGMADTGNGAAGAKSETAVADPNDGIDAEDIVELAKAEAEKERKRIGKYVARLRRRVAFRQEAHRDRATKFRIARAK